MDTLGMGLWRGVIWLEISAGDHGPEPNPSHKYYQEYSVAMFFLRALSQTQLLAHGQHTSRHFHFSKRRQLWRDRRNCQNRKPSPLWFLQLLITEKGTMHRNEVENCNNVTEIGRIEGDGSSLARDLPCELIDLPEAGAGGEGGAGGGGEGGNIASTFNTAGQRG